MKNTSLINCFCKGRKLIWKLQQTIKSTTPTFGSYKAQKNEGFQKTFSNPGVFKFSKKMTWDDAQRHCETQRSHLATFDTEQEYLDVSSRNFPQNIWQVFKK